MATPTQIRRRGRFSLILGTLVAALMVAAVAYADNVQNDVTTPGEIVTVTAGGSGAEVKYSIAANSGDGQAGCNATDGSAATVTPNVPTGVTKTPSSVTFTNCTDAQGITFAAGASVTPGDYEITVSVSDSGVGTYNTNPAKFTLRVQASSNTAPNLMVPANMTVEGNTTGGANVTYTGLSASDAEDGDLTSSIICNPASGSFFALGGPHTVNCSVTDSGGLSDSDSFEVTVVDTTAPSINAATVPSNMTVTATSLSGAVVNYTNPTATDIVDPNPVVTCTPASGSTFAPGTTTVSCTAKDASNNTSGASTFTVKVQFAYNGFFSPVNMTLLNSVKGGSTVPLKFNIPIPGGYIDSTAVSTGFSAVKISCTGTRDELTPEELIDPLATPGKTELRWDATSEQFVQGWATPKVNANTCYRASVNLVGGQKISADFELRK